MSKVSVRPLGDLCEVVNGSTPNTKDSGFWGGPHQWITPKEMGSLKSPFISRSARTLSDSGLNSISAKLLPKFSIILSSRAPIGYLAVNKEPMATNQGCKGLIPSAELDYMFLYYFLLANRERLNSLGTGTTFAELSSTALKRFEIPLPPLDEQKRIVAKLDKALEQNDLMKTVARQRVQEFARIKEAGIRDRLIAAGSEHGEKSLGQIFDIARGGSPRPIKDFLTHAEDGVNWIKISDATRTGKYITDTKQKIRPEGVSRSRKVFPGDFLLTNSMSFGRPYILQTEGCIHDGWLVLSGSSEVVDSEFMYYALGSQYLADQFNKLAYGSTVRNLNIDSVKKARVPLPNVGAQQELSAQLRAIESLVDRLTSLCVLSIQKMENLESALLTSAFSGDL